MNSRKLNLKAYFVAGFAVIGFVFGGLLVWSIAAPFEGAVVAAGSLTVESNRKAVQHLEGGIVRQINVSEGDRVGAGDVLIRLDGTATAANLATVESRLAELLAREARLVAERDGLGAPKLREELGAFGQSAALQAILVSQQTLMQARRDSRDKQAAILRNRVQQLRARVDGLRKEVAAKRSESRLVAEELVGLEQLFSKGLAPRTRILELQRLQSRLLGEGEALTSAIATTEVQIGEAAIELERMISSFREEVLAELREVTGEISELTEKRVAARDKLDRLDILAPRDGYAIGVRTHTVGGVISPTEPVMFIVPEGDRLIAKIQISPVDIDKIHVGQPARLRFSAFDQRSSPEIDSRVTRISADSVVDEQTGAMYYEVVVDVPRDDATVQRFALVPGMPVEAMMQTESRSVISYLTKPFFDSMHRTFRE